MRRWRGRDIKTCALAVLLMLGFAGLDLVGPKLDWLRRLEILTFDLKMRWRGERRPGPEIVIVSVDEKTVAEYGRWPIPREKFARLIDYLHMIGARTIAFDVLFPEPEPAVSPELAGFLDDIIALLQDRQLSGLATEARTRKSIGDPLLAKTIANADSVILPFMFRFDEKPATPSSSFLDRAAYATLRAEAPYEAPALHPTGVLEPIAPFADAAAGLASAMAAFDIDGAPRYDHTVMEYDLDYFPSMPIRIAQHYLRVPWEQVAVHLGRGVSVGPVYVPTDASMRIVVNYRGRAGTYPTFSFVDVLSGKVPEALFRDKIVLIGTNIIGVRDTFQTPFTSVLPGVERMATIADSVLHGDHIRRTEDAVSVEIGALLLVGMLLGLAIARLSIAGAAVFALAIVVAIVAGEQIAFERAGLWFSLALPMLAVALTYSIVAGYRYGLLEAENRRIRSAFARYLAPNMLQALADHPHELTLAGERRELTVLFCDIHRFRALTRELDARSLTRLVNEFFTVAGDCVLAHDGTIDKYIRDGVMAFWNAPVHEPRHAEIACRAALDLSAEIERLNQRLAADGLPAIEIGIGISSGECTVGALGSKRRFEYSAVGAAADAAAALERLTAAYGVKIMLGPETAARVVGMAVLPVEAARLEVSEEPIELHLLLGDETAAARPDFATLHEQHLLFHAAFEAGDFTTAAMRLETLGAHAPQAVQRLYRYYAVRLREKQPQTVLRRPRRRGASHPSPISPE
jgi:adenylate cyclase